MKIMKIYQKLLKMMFINNYCTDFIFEQVIVCVTKSYSSSMLSLIFNFLIVYHNNLLKLM